MITINTQLLIVIILIVFLGIIEVSYWHFASRFIDKVTIKPDDPKVRLAEKRKRKLKFPKWYEYVYWVVMLFYSFSILIVPLWFPTFFKQLQKNFFTTGPSEVLISWGFGWAGLMSLFVWIVLGFILIHLILRFLFPKLWMFWWYYEKKLFYKRYNLNASERDIQDYADDILHHVDFDLAFKKEWNHLKWGLLFVLLTLPIYYFLFDSYLRVTPEGLGVNKFTYINEKVYRWDEVTQAKLSGELVYDSDEAEYDFKPNLEVIYTDGAVNLWNSLGLGSLEKHEVQKLIDHISKNNVNFEVTPLSEEQLESLSRYNNEKEVISLFEYAQTKIP